MLPYSIDWYVFLHLQWTRGKKHAYSHAPLSKISHVLSKLSHIDVLDISKNKKNKKISRVQRFAVLDRLVEHLQWTRSKLSHILSNLSYVMAGRQCVAVLDGLVRLLAAATDKGQEACLVTPL